MVWSSRRQGVVLTMVDEVRQGEGMKAGEWAGEGKGAGMEIGTRVQARCGIGFVTQAWHAVAEEQPRSGIIGPAVRPGVSA